MRGYACRSFLLHTLVLFVNIHYSSADVRRIDDGDLSVRYDDSWTSVSDQSAWDGTLHWSNISGAISTFTFTGTSVQVFGAFKPVGTWSMQSQYVVEGGPPTHFLPDQTVEQESFQQQFFDSGTLERGEHTLEITNLGSQLWIDYFVVSDDPPAAGGSPPPTIGVTTSSGTSSASPTARGITSSFTGTASPSPVSRTTRTSVGSSSPNDVVEERSTTSGTSSSSSSPTSSRSTTPAPLSANAPSSASSSPTRIAISDAISPTSPHPSPFPFSPPGPVPLPSNASTSPPAPGSGSGTAQARTTGRGPGKSTSRTVINGLIAGVAVAALAVLAILGLGLGCWCRYRRRRARRLGRGRGRYVSSTDRLTQRTPKARDLDGDDTSMFGGDESFRSPSSAATLLTYGYRYSNGNALADERPMSSATELQLIEAYLRSDGYMRSAEAGVNVEGGPGGGGSDALSVEDSEVRSVKSGMAPVCYVHGQAS